MYYSLAIYDGFQEIMAFDATSHDQLQQRETVVMQSVAMVTEVRMSGRLAFATLKVMEGLPSLKGTTTSLKKAHNWYGDHAKFIIGNFDEIVHQVKVMEAS